MQVENVSEKCSI